MLRWQDRARAWHTVTAAVAIVALLAQLVLVLNGDATLLEHTPPALPVRLGRLVSYFTIQSNVLVAVSAVTLARDPERDGAGWRVLRLAALVGITVTGLVHFFLLRPLLHLHGWSLVCDKLLHMVVPLLAAVGWALFGPRPRVSGRTVAWTLAWPVAWLVWTLCIGALTGWFPYPFLDFHTHGWLSVLGTCAAIVVLFLVLFLAAHRIDRRWPAPQLPRSSSSSATALIPASTSANEVDSGESPTRNPPGSR